MNNKAHLRPNDYDKNGDIIPMACKEEKGDLISREALKEAFKTWKTMDDYYHNTDCNDIPFSEAFDLIDNAPTVELFCSYLSDGEVRQPCIEAPCEHESELIKAYTKGFDTGVETVKNERPQDKCENCMTCVHHIDDVCEHCYESNVNWCTGYRSVGDNNDVS